MNKANQSHSLTKKVVLSCLISVVLCNLIYALIIPFIMNYSYAIQIEFFKKVIFVTFVVSPLAIISVYLFYKPIEKHLDLIEENKPVPETLVLKARKALITIPMFLFIIGVLSYLGGLAINMLRDSLENKTIELDHFIARFLASATWGVLIGVVSSRFINVMLIEAKMKMNITNLEQDKSLKYESTRQHLLFSGILLFIFITVFSGILFYNYNKHTVMSNIAQMETIIQKAESENLTITQLRNNFTELQGSLLQEFYGHLFSGITVVIVLFLIVIILYFISITEIQSHINNLNRQMNHLEKDQMDLTKRINIISYDDIGQMTGKINGIINHLSSTFLNIREHTASVYESGNRTHKTLIDSLKKAVILPELISRTKETSNNQTEIVQKTVSRFQSVFQQIYSSSEKIDTEIKTVEKTSETIKSMIDSFQSFIENALSSEKLFTNLALTIDKGNNEIKNSVISTHEMLETSEKVKDILGIIADIADQSHTLALNAAIEASHAGEFGKGFAIVAEEIRNLADTTAVSTKDIADLILLMDEKNTRGLNISVNLQAIFKELNEGMQLTSGFIRSIADFSHTQAAAAKTSLFEVEKMLELTYSLKENSTGLTQENTAIESLIENLKKSSDNLIELNSQLSSGIEYIVVSTREMKESFEQSMERITELSKQTLRYRVE